MKRNTSGAGWDMRYSNLLPHFLSFSFNSLQWNSGDTWIGDKGLKMQQEERKGKFMHCQLLMANFQWNILSVETVREVE